MMRLTAWCNLVECRYRKSGHDQARNFKAGGGGSQVVNCGQVDVYRFSCLPLVVRLEVIKTPGHTWAPSTESRTWLIKHIRIQPPSQHSHKYTVCVRVCPETRVSVHSAHCLILDTPTLTNKADEQGNITYPPGGRGYMTPPPRPLHCSKSGFFFFF